MSEGVTTVYFKAMSVLGCEVGGVLRRSKCHHNCCNGENCVIWLEKLFRDYERLLNKECIKKYNNGEIKRTEQARVLLDELHRERLDYGEYCLLWDAFDALGDELAGYREAEKLEHNYCRNCGKSLYAPGVTFDGCCWIEAALQRDAQS